MNIINRQQKVKQYNMTTLQTSNSLLGLSLPVKSKRKTFDVQFRQPPTSTNLRKSTGFEYIGRKSQLQKSPIHMPVKSLVQHFIGQNVQDNKVNEVLYDNTVFESSSTGDSATNSLQSDSENYISPSENENNKRQSMRSINKSREKKRQMKRVNSVDVVQKSIKNRNLNKLLSNMTTGKQKLKIVDQERNHDEMIGEEERSGAPETRFVSFEARENHQLLKKLLKLFEWKREEKVQEEHILMNNFSGRFNKAVNNPMSSNLMVRNNVSFSPPPRNSTFSQVERSQTLTQRRKEIRTLMQQNVVQMPEGLQSPVDVLWIGSQDPALIHRHNLNHFTVIYNGLQQAKNICDSAKIRDQFLQMRSSIHLKSKRYIPHFFLESYKNNYKEMLALQKYVNFELKILPQTSQDPEVIDRMHQSRQRITYQAPKKEIALLQMQQKEANQQATAAHSLHIQIGQPTLTNSNYNPMSYKYSNQSDINRISIPIQTLVNQQMADNFLETNHIGEEGEESAVKLEDFLYQDNTVFRHVTQTAIILRKGFDPAKFFGNQKKTEKARQISLLRQNRQQHKEKQDVIFKQLLNPLLFRGRNICTVTVYVFVENFNSLRSHIFNNVKVRFRHQNEFTMDDTKNNLNNGNGNSKSNDHYSTFGQRPTLNRFLLSDLIKLLNNRVASRLASLEEQKSRFWNRICKKIVCILLMMKSLLDPALETPIPVSRFCNLFQFRFQLDNNGKPWFLEVRPDKSQFRTSANQFDKFKRHLLAETCLLLETKLKSQIKKQQVQTNNFDLLRDAMNIEGIEDFLAGSLESFQHGRGGGLGFSSRNTTGVQDWRQVQIGSYKVSKQADIIKKFKMFDKMMHGLGKDQIALYLNHHSLFDENSNAERVSLRRVERQHFLKLRNHEEQNTNYFKKRYDKKSSILLSSFAGGSTQIQKRKMKQDKAIFEFEQQMIEDISMALACLDPEHLQVKIQSLKKIGSILLREGFRMLFFEEFKSDLQMMINQNDVLSKVADFEPRWVQNSLKFLFLGVKDPLVFLYQLTGYLKKITKFQEKQSKSSSILKKYNAQSDLNDGQESQFQNNPVENDSKNLNRRFSQVIDPTNLTQILKKSETSVYIRNQLKSYFNNVQMKKEDNKNQQNQQFTKKRSIHRLNKQTSLDRNSVINEETEDFCTTSSNPMSSASPHQTNSEGQKSINIRVDKATEGSSSSFDINRSNYTQSSASSSARGSGTRSDIQYKLEFKDQKDVDLDLNIGKESIQLQSGKLLLNQGRPRMLTTVNLNEKKLQLSKKQSFEKQKSSEQESKDQDEQEENLRRLSSFYKQLEVPGKSQIRKSGERLLEQSKQSSKLLQQKIKLIQKDTPSNKDGDSNSQHKAFNNSKSPSSLISKQLGQQQMLNKSRNMLAQSKSQSLLNKRLDFKIRRPLKLNQTLGGHRTNLTQNFQKFLDVNFRKSLPYQKQTVEQQQKRLLDVNKLSHLQSTDLEANIQEKATLKYQNHHQKGSTLRRSLGESESEHSEIGQSQIGRISRSNSQLFTMHGQSQSEILEHKKPETALERRQTIFKPQATLTAQYIQKMQDAKKQRIERAKGFANRTLFNQDLSFLETKRQIMFHADEIEKGDTVSRMNFESDSPKRHKKATQKVVKVPQQHSETETDSQDQTQSDSSNCSSSSTVSEEGKIFMSAMEASQRISTLAAKRKRLTEIREFTEGKVRDKDFQFKPLFPLKARFNSKADERGFKIRGKGQTAEIYLSINEIRALAPGEDNALTRRYLIDNAAQDLMKLFETHDFEQQVTQGICANKRQFREKSNES